MIYDLINWGKLRKALLYGALLLAGLGVQTLVLSHIPVLGVRAAFVPALVVFMAMYEGPVWGCMYGLAAGLLYDGATGCTVLHTCVLPLLGFTGGFLSQFFLNRRTFACVCMAFAGLLACSLAEGGRLLLRGDGPWSILWVGLLQSVWGMFPAMAFYYPLRSLGRKKPEDL